MVWVYYIRSVGINVEFHRSLLKNITATFDKTSVRCTYLYLPIIDRYTYTIKQTAKPQIYIVHREALESYYSPTQLHVDKPICVSVVYYHRCRCLTTRRQILPYLVHLSLLKLI